MKGVYVLILEVKKPIKLEFKGKEYTLKKNFYCYVGSALGPGEYSLENRLNRHFTFNKKIFWNIDLITTNPNVKTLFALVATTKANMECNLSRSIYERGLGDVIIPKFGAHDCKRKCPTHFYRIIDEDVDRFLDELIKIFYEFGLTPKRWPE